MRVSLCWSTLVQMGISLTLAQNRYQPRSFTTYVPTSGAEQICRCRTNPIHSTRSRIQCCNLVPRSQHCGGARRSESVLTRLRSHRLHKPEGQRERPLLRAQGEKGRSGQAVQIAHSNSCDTGRGFKNHESHMIPTGRSRSVDVDAATRDRACVPRDGGVARPYGIV